MSNCGGADVVGLRFHPVVQDEIRTFMDSASCLSVVPIQLGDWDHDGALEPEDLEALDACLAQGFESAGCVETFDMDGDGVLTAADRQILAGMVCTPVVYCSPAATNSSGLSATMDWSGTASVSANDLVLIASRLPAFQNGLFAYSPDRASLPLGNGTLCVGHSTLGFVIRLPGILGDASGVLSHALDNAAPPVPAGLITPGSTWDFTCWFRDNAAPPAFFNFADGLEVLFCP
jgi:hypothetical protein